MNKKYIVIVDPFIDSKKIAEGFNREGIECIAIISGYESFSDMPAFFSGRYDASLYTKQFFLKNKFQDIVKQLAEINIIAIFAGADMGSMATDKLNHALELPCANPLETSAARVNKYESTCVVAEHGIPTAKQIKLNANVEYNLSELLNDFQFPVVFKPTQSAGSFGVFICDNLEDVEQALCTLSSLTDEYHNKIQTECVLQEKLNGDEFVVDIMSFAGTHYVSAVYVYKKELINNRPQWRSVKWVDPQSSEAKEVISYANRVLDAVNFNYGPAHVEIFLTPEGPRLVEVNPRVSGSLGFFNKMCKQITGQNQIDLLVECYSKGKVEDFSPLQSKNNLRGEMVYLVNNSNSSKIKLNALKQLQQLPSCQFTHLLHKVHFPKTIDIHSLAGYLLLINNDSEQLIKDYRFARQIELFGNE